MCFIELKYLAKVKALINKIKCYILLNNIACLKRLKVKRYMYNIKIKLSLISNKNDFNIWLQIKMKIHAIFNYYT